MKTNALFLGLLLILTLVCDRQALAFSLEGDAEKSPEFILEELIGEYDNHETPGGVVLVMRDGEVIYTRAFGMANLSHDILFADNTPTNIGSTSKQFTAFAIALLEEKGLLSIEDDIRMHIPELPDLGDTIRLRHLISHTSGYREYLNSFAMSGRNLNDFISQREIIPMIQRQPELQNIPGESFNYNNTGYAMLAMVVARVTGEDFPVWIKENVFEPLGMHNTQVRTHPGQVISGFAQGYSVNDENESVALPDIYASMGAGGIYSTALDLAKWVGNFHDPVVGTPEIIRRMQLPFAFNSGEAGTYGYGLFLGDLNGLKMVQHGGADVAHRSSLLMFPEIRGAVITQSNNSRFPGQVANSVAEAFFGDVMDLPDQVQEETGDFVYDAEMFDELAGRYELEAAPGFILEFTREGDTLYTQATGQSRFEIYASSDSTFYMTVVEASMTFHRNEDGVADAVTLHQNGHHRANRIMEAAWEPSPEDLEMYKGRYYSDELEAFYSVVLDDEGRLVLQHRRLSDNPLKAGSKDEFSGGFPISGIQFLRNDDGVVYGFKASSGRSFGILFEKQFQGHVNAN